MQLFTFSVFGGEVTGMEKGKVVSIEDRIPKLKNLRKKKTNRRLILLLSIFFILIGCVLYFLSPLSYVKTIQIEGNQYLSDKKIINLSKINTKQSIWNVDIAHTEANILKNPEIKSAEVVPVFPNSLKITVEENERMAYLRKGKSFMPILENGVILKSLESTEIPVFAPILIGFTEGEPLNLLLEEFTKLSDEIVNSISEVHYRPTKTDKYHITLFMNDGFEVTATALTFSDKMKHYPSIVSQLDPKEKGVIDLEVGSFFQSYKENEDDSEQ